MAFLSIALVFWVVVRVLLGSCYCVLMLLQRYGHTVARVQILVDRV